MSIDLFALAWKVEFPGKPIKKLVLLSLADQANDRDHHCWPTYETIAKRCGMSRRTAITTISDLEREGFIRRIARYKVGGLHTSNAFWVNRAAMEAAVTADNGETASPLSAPVVIVDHHNGAAGSPSMVIDDHLNGDPRSPRTPIEPPTEPTGEPPATAPAAEPSAAPVAVAAVPADPDPIPPILDWIGFDDFLTPREYIALNPPILLAWAYWVQLKTAERAPRVHNPVGLVRAQWRKGVQPRADLLRLARGWLALDDDSRGRLLGRLEWATDYGQYDPGDPLDDEFPDIPLATAAAVFAATGGQLAPPRLMPVCGADRPTPAPDSTSGPGRSVGQIAQSPVWKTALADLEMQMTRATFTAWLRDATATEVDDELVIHVGSAAAVDWLSNRLHDLIQRTVAAAAGRPLTIHYEARQ